jgi:hypothetical protein
MPTPSFKSLKRFRPVTLLAASAAVLAIAAQAPAASKVPISFDDYHGYTATVKYLKDVAAAYPQITALLEIGKSNMGRPVYVLVVSNRKTGTTVDAHVALRNPRAEGVKNVAPMTPDMGKPGHWICGATHGNEYTGTEVCLYTIDKLVTGYGADKETTALVDGKTFYICPIVNPDGVFNSLEKGVSQRQNSALTDDDGDGKANEDGPDDLDGDGVIAQFRYKDPRGAYVIDDEDPRLMVRVRPNEKTDKPRWSVVAEDKDNDGDKRRGEDPEAGIDLNRNFPEGWWNDQGFAGGSGDYPTSAPEARAVAEFFVTHPNIFMAQFYHTMGGFTYRPLGTAPSTRLDPRDVAVFDLVMGKKYLETIGEDVPEAWKDPARIPALREELRKTSKNKYAIERGYELPYGWKVSYDEVNDRRYGFGMTTDWDFLQLGVWSITTELWNPAKDIPGLARTSGAGAGAEGPAERQALERALLKLQDEKYGGKLFARWKTFKHPELGEGELGGWDPRVAANAWPGEPLIGVCDRHYRFEMFRAGLLPDVVVSEAKARLLYTSESASEATAAVAGGEVRIKKGGAKGPYRIIEVTAVIENKGPLATHTARGSELRGNREDVVWLVGARDKVTFLQGTPYQRLGVLDGATRVPGAAAGGGGGGGGMRGGGPAGPPQEYTPPTPQGQRRGGPPGPTQVRQGGARREVRWLVAVEGGSPLKIVVSSQKGGTKAVDVKVQ